jgi:hypothetical protein
MVLVAAGYFVLQSLLPQSAQAQTDWLKSGKDLLGNMTGAQEQKTSLPDGLTDTQISSGLRDALKVGTQNVVGQLGKMDGFNADPSIHIPLPESLRQVKSALAAIGMSAMADDLELKLNRAAEEATLPAKELFLNAIESMTLDDVKGIYEGPDDAATRYFREKMSGPLAEEMQPIVEKTLDQVGAVQAYDSVMGQYASIPFMPNFKTDLNSYVVGKGMDGIFHYLAIEEAAIRKNPVKRTTEILQKVFGAR